MFGPDDAFLTIILKLLRLLPFYPMFVRGLVRLQPAYAEDVAESIVRIMQRAETYPMTFECGGPNVYSYEQFLRTVAYHAGLKPLLVSAFAASPMLSCCPICGMIKQIEKIAFDFTAILGEQDVTAAAASLRVSTLLYSGGLSPYLTQRIVGRLASIIPGAEAKHLPAAGHLLPISHAKVINPDLVRHIVLADDFAGVLLASPPDAAVERSKQPNLRLMPR